MLTSSERRAVTGITLAVVVRMLGLFLLLPVLSPYVRGLEGSTPILTGLAVGVYGLTQALFQVPFGYLSDRLGRKPVIVGGLFTYALGSVLGGVAGSVWTMILARMIQGAGAISSAAISLAADLIREEVRAGAFARIGASISITFAISIVVAPVIAGRFGVPFIFFLTALLSLTALVYLLLFIKEPERVESRSSVRYPVFTRDLVVLSLSVFLLHVFLISLFTVVPIDLINTYRIPKPQHWKVYLPVILVSAVLMIPAVAYAERKGRMREILIAGISLISLGFFVHTVVGGLKGLVLMLFLFFLGFHFLEPVLPSLLTRLTREEVRGLSTGIFNTSQFVGAFAGGLMGGVFLKTGTGFMLTVNLLLSLLWLHGIVIWSSKVKF